MYPINIRDSIKKLHEGRVQVNSALREIRELIADGKTGPRSCNIQTLEDMLRDGVPSGRCLQYAASCISYGCDPDEVKSLYLQYRA